MRRYATGVFATGAMVLVAVAGCGGDDSSTATTAGTDAAVTTSTEAATAASSTVSATAAPRTTAPATTAAATTAPATAAPTTTVPACARPASATGSIDRQLSVGGLDRHYLLYVPTSYTGADTGLVVNLHGSGSDSAQQMAGSELAGVADAHGFIVVAPDAAVSFDAGATANGGAWNIPGVPLVDGSAPPEGAPDDVAFIETLVDTLRDEFCIDRTAVTGTSGGGRMSSYLGCFSDRFDVIAPVAGLRVADGCAPVRPVDVIAFHGTADVVNPYAGGGPASWGPQSVPEAAAAWAALESCTSGPAATNPTAGTSLDVWSGCTGGVEVRLHTVADGGHNWPGGQDAAAAMPALAAIVGMTTQEIDAGELIWERLNAVRR